jgi:hypothetical protein
MTVVGATGEKPPPGAGATQCGDGPEAIFPIRFSADPDLATGVVAGRVDGFYRGTRMLEVEP